MDPAAPARSQNLIPTEEVINRAKSLGVKFGFGDSNNRIRYLVKNSLLPHQSRKFTGGRIVAHLPETAIDRLVEIQKLQDQLKYTIPQLVEHFNDPSVQDARKVYEGEDLDINTPEGQTNLVSEEGTQTSSTYVDADAGAGVNILPSSELDKDEFDLTQNDTNSEGAQNASNSDQLQSPAKADNPNIEIKHEIVGEEANLFAEDDNAGHADSAAPRSKVLNVVLSGVALVVLLTAVGGVYAFSTGQDGSLFSKSADFLKSLLGDNSQQANDLQQQSDTTVAVDTTSDDSKVQTGDVLSSLVINIPTEFKSDITALNVDLNFDGSNLTLGGITADSVTASNLLYSITAGDGVSVSDGQNVTITNTGVLSLGGKTGDVKLQAGDGIAVSGAKITNDGVLSFAGETGDVELTAGDDIDISGLSVALQPVIDTVTTINFAAGSFIDLSLVTHDSSTVQGLKLPQAASFTAPSTGEGFIAWDTSNDKLIAFDGSSWNNVDTQVTADSLDYIDFVDAMTLDATTSVNFYDGTSTYDYRFHNSNTSSELLFMDGSTGYIGIGTTAPDDKLDVAGAIDTTSFYKIDNIKVFDYDVNRESVKIGHEAANALTSGYENVAIGYRSMYTPTLSYYNVAIGGETLYSLDASSAGQENTAVGHTSLHDVTTGSGNIGVGSESGYGITTGDYNIGIGQGATSGSGAGVTGSQNIGIGVQALDTVTSGSDNIAIGAVSLDSLTSGSDNISIGRRSALYHQTGDYNVFIGLEAGIGTANRTASDNNVAIGYQAGYNLGTGDDGNVFLGSQAGYNETGSNKLYIENSNADQNSALIYGDFSTDTLTFNADVGIGTTSPSSLLSLYSASTSTSFQGFDLNWQPASSTALTGDLFAINIGSSGTAANLFAVYDNSSPVFTVSQTSIESAVPHAFTAAGDVSMSYDLNFTNPTAAYINFEGPGYIRTNHPSGNYDLTLSAANSGQVIVADNFKLYSADPSIVFDTLTATDTDYWAGVIEDASGTDDDIFAIGDGTTVGTNPFFAINTSGNVGIGTTAPSSFLLQVAGDVGPNANDTYSLGSDSLRWADAYLGPGTLHIGTSTADEYTLSYDTTSNYLGFNVNGSGNPEIVMDSSGFLGIGTTAPNYTLDVTSGTTDNVSRFASSDDLAQILLSDNDTNGYLGVKDSKAFFGQTSSLSPNNLVVDSSGLVGIGTTAPTYKLDVVSSSTTGILNLTGDSITSGTGLSLSLDGLTAGTGLLVESDGSNTLSGDLFKLRVGSGTTVSGNIFAIYDDTTPIFTVNQTGITSALPHSFTAAGDVSFSYDTIYTNQTASTIQAYGPLTIQSGESFENLDLTLEPSGSGSVIVDGGSDLEIYTGQSLVFDTDESGDTYMTHDAANDRIRLYVDATEMFRFDTGGNESNGTITTTAFDLAETYPTMDSDLEAGDVVSIIEPSDEDKDTTSKYLVAKAEPETISKVLGVVSSKPGFRLGGGSFNTEFCSAVAADESIAREQAITRELSILISGQVGAEIESGAIKVKENATADELLDTENPLPSKQQVIDERVAELLADQDKLSEMLGAGLVNSIEDKIQACKSVKQVDIALAGRVPVKFDNSNGEIKAGDLLTPSTVSLGKAAKLMSKGWAIGRALEDSGEDKDTIMMFVMLSWNTGDSDLALAYGASATGQVLSATASTVDYDKLNQSLAEITKVDTDSTGHKRLALYSNLNVLGTINGLDIATSGTITAGFLKIDGTSDTISVVGGGELKLQSGDGPLGNIEAFNGKLVMTTDGGIISEASIQADTIAAREFKVLGATNEKDSSAGSGEIESGKTEVTIDNNLVNEDSKIFITLTGDVGGRSVSIKKKDEGSFVVKISSISGDNVKFDYLIVGVDKE